MLTYILKDWVQWERMVSLTAADGRVVRAVRSTLTHSGHVVDLYRSARTEMACSIHPSRWHAFAWQSKLEHVNMAVEVGPSGPMLRWDATRRTILDRCRHG